MNRHTHKAYFYVYVIKSLKTGGIYIGCTGDLNKRIVEHNDGKVEYTRSRLPFKLIYFEGYKNKQDAFHREKNLKLRANALTGLKRRIQGSLTEAL